ncbi:polynucleotide kinase 3 phosphatase-domain-containing protein [Boletus edulis BED1]|uniref:Polynucleotide kinase 3 phosphatase-domain-containing protein n=1 Tax=Boletus edulis BED1 TaxID=1328754 RepID=A0AAD4GCZ0_BOLED|nr:polynucleotide kinase 3 phosphatase-domain-containing protein [Boletus edulis BED1]
MSEPGQSATEQPTKKRNVADLQEGADVADDSMNSARKVAKIHPFFSKPSASSSAFQWLKPALGPKRTCLHGIHLDPPARPNVALFDLDGTMIQWQKNSGKGADALKWAWWRQCVPTKLKALHQDGYAIVVISNQALKTAALENWKKKIPLIANALPDVPFRLFAACAKDGYRKPMPGMWYELERIFKEHHVDIDKKTTFFVGDAAGRAHDFASTDRKWAMNIGIPFHTPEEYFLALPKAPYKLPGFHVSSLPKTTDLLCPPTAEIVPALSRPELVLLTGFPCLGKSSFYCRHFAPAGYVHVNQDTLGTRPKCLKAAEEALKAGKSCVIDNTNRDAPTRKLYIDLAKKVGVTARCFLFEGSMDLAWHNNLYRAYNQPSSKTRRDVIPYLAFISFRDNYEEPQTSEGFSEVIKLNWVFEGDEEARQRWSMWLQIDGK